MLHRVISAGTLQDHAVFPAGDICYRHMIRADMMFFIRFLLWTVPQPQRGRRVVDGRGSHRTVYASYLLLGQMEHRIIGKVRQTAEKILEDKNSKGAFVLWGDNDF